MIITLKHIVKYSLIVTVLLASTSSFSQDGQYVEVRDLETWTSAEVKLKVKEIWSFGLHGQVRMDKNSTDLKNYFTELNSAAKVSKNLKFGAALRYTNRNDNLGQVQGSEHYFRFHIDAAFMHEVKRLDLKYRLRYSNSNELGITKEEGDYHENYWRLKTSADYNIKNWKFDPEFSAEIFNKQVKYGLSNGFDQFRVTLGTSYKTTKYGKIGMYYRLQREIKSSYPMTENIFRIKYTYTFKL